MLRRLKGYLFGSDKTSSSASQGDTGSSETEKPASPSASAGDRGPSETVKPVTCLVIGAGCRGTGHSSYAGAFPKELKIVGVAEPREFYRNRMQKRYNLPEDAVFETWEDAAKKEKFADCVIIATTDRLHKDPAVAFANLGYHILLEKPMAVSEDECREIVAACKKNSILLSVCHVLRYSPWAIMLKAVIDKGEIGEVVNIQHTEPVGYWHFAHSYVRGNWRNEAQSSNSLLAKCCHDVDLINWWMSKSGRCVRVSSFGHLTHFRKEDKPKDAGDRCTDCKIESSCPYSAKKLYLGLAKKCYTGWPVSVITETPDIESVAKAIKNGPYGRCVYECDNDVMSHQVTNFQFENGATASLTMVAFTQKVCEREVMVYGTKGQITVDTRNNMLDIYDFLTESTKTVDCPVESVALLGGHGGADYYLIRSFVTALRSGNTDAILTGADETLASHLLVFAAEKARKENSVVEIRPDGTF